MRLKELFTVPEGKKITERMFGRVLLSSICSMLLCMACLAGTTWAWFTVSIENTDNVIQIATVSETVTITGTNDENTVEAADGVYNLENGKYSVQVQLTSDATAQGDLNKQKTPVYVLMSVTGTGTENDPAYYYFPFEDGMGEANRELEIYCAPVALRFSVTWVKPAAAIQIGDEAVIIGNKPTELTEMPTTVPTTMPEETTEANEEATVPPTTEAAATPEETTVPPATGAQTDPEETTTPATEGTTVPPATESATISEESNDSATTEPSVAPSETTTLTESD